MRTLNKLLMIGVTVSLFGLGGCASVQPNVAANDNAEIDQAQIAAIEHFAKQRGVRIYWLHYPQKQ